MGNCARKMQDFELDDIKNKGLETIKNNEALQAKLAEAEEMKGHLENLANIEVDPEKLQAKIEEKALETLENLTDAEKWRL